MSVEPLYAPTATVIQLAVQVPELELDFAKYSYGFVRRQRWKNDVEWFNADSFQVMPQQLLRIEQFVITRDHWTLDEINTIENLFDAVKGRAYPFLFTAPDDGETYEVRFEEDLFSYVADGAEHRSGSIVLTCVGDLDNSIDNGLVYPEYVESTTTTTATTTSSSSSSTESTTTTSTLEL